MPIHVSYFFQTSPTFTSPSRLLTFTAEAYSEVILPPCLFVVTLSIDGRSTRTCERPFKYLGKKKLKHVVFWRLKDKMQNLPKISINVCPAKLGLMSEMKWNEMKWAGWALFHVISLRKVTSFPLSKQLVHTGTWKIEIRLRTTVDGRNLKQPPGMLYQPYK